MSANIQQLAGVDRTVHEPAQAPAVPSGPLHGHPRNSPSARSRREPSKIAQDKLGAVLGKRPNDARPPRRGERMGSPNPAEVQALRTAPTGRESMGRTHSQGFTLGYFHILPTGGTARHSSVLPPFRTAAQAQAAFSLVRSTNLSVKDWYDRLNVSHF
jgi:hypothetical protein